LRVAVLGAGLQGACIALELAARGVAVDLVDRDDRPVNRASLRNEGKVHLGLVYANDPTSATADAMLDGALCFRRLLGRWTAGRFDDVPRSRPFLYLVARNSLLSSDALARHYHRVDDRYRARIAADGALDYLGQRPDRLWWRVGAAALQAVTSPELVQEAFGTVEVAVDLPSLAVLLRKAIAGSPGVRFHPGRRVLEVRRSESGFRVEGSEVAGAWTLECDQVVNATWDGRLEIDVGMGLVPPAAWSHRLKYRVLVELPAALRDRSSVTIVLGAYGDVVVHPRLHGYVSWYPECLRGWSEQLAPPAAWEDPCRGVVAEETAREIAARVLAAIDPWVPGLAASRPVAVDAGTIFAFGDTDITDAGSRLHRRDLMGVRSVDGYHSVNTGKLTTAPAFAIDAADAVTGARSSEESDHEAIRG
jgi:hypothetical protein